MVAWIKRKFNKKWLLLIVPILLLSVIVVAGGVDDTAFTVGASRVEEQACMFDDVSVDSVDEGDKGICRMSANRCQYVNIRDGSGDEWGVDILDAGADNVANTLNSMVSACQPYGFDGSTWDRIYAGTQTNGKCQCVAPTSDAYFMVSKTTSANAVNNTLFVELSDGTNAFLDNTSSPGYFRIQDNDSTDLVNATSNALDVNVAAPRGTTAAASSVATAPANDAYYMVSKTTSANAVNNTLFVELSDGTNAFLDNTSSPGYVRQQDGDSTVLTDVVDAGSDNMANTLNGPVCHAWGYGWDGSAWDRIGATSGAMNVNISSPLGEAGAAASIPVVLASDKYVRISDDTNANSTSNPIGVQISVDGTNAMSGANPLVISKDTSANAVNNAIFVQHSDGTNAYLDNTTYPGYFRLEDNDTTDLLNLTSNSMDTNLAYINGTAPNVNGGAKDAGTQTVTLATDDPAVVALQLLDNAYTAGTTSLRVEEIDPLDQKLGSSTLADVTDGTDGTYYYYVDKEGFRYEGIQATLDGGSGSVTVTIECTIQDDGTAQASCSYVDVTSDVAGVASWTATFLFTDNDQKLGACKYVRYKVVAATAASNDADWTLFHKKWF